MDDTEKKFEESPSGSRSIEEHDEPVQALIQLHDFVQSMPSAQKTALQVIFLFLSLFIYIENSLSQTGHHKPLYFIS